MVKVTMFKMPFQTPHFNKNQKVWVQFFTGALAAKVVGRYRGKKRYVSAWVRWESKSREAPDFKEIEVDNAFANKYDLVKAL